MVVLGYENPKFWSVVALKYIVSNIVVEFTKYSKLCRRFKHFHFLSSQVYCFPKHSIQYYNYIFIVLIWIIISCLNFQLNMYAHQSIMYSIMFPCFKSKFNSMGSHKGIKYYNVMICVMVTNIHHILQPCSISCLL